MDFATAAAMAAASGNGTAAAAAIAGGLVGNFTTPTNGNGNGSSSSNDEGFSAIQALVAYLRMEADLAEQKGKRLRAQAALMGQQFHVSQSLQEAYGKYRTVVVKIFHSFV
jgi:outer membrane lipoprotein SlyB